MSTPLNRVRLQPPTVAEMPARRSEDRKYGVATLLVAIFQIGIGAFSTSVAQDTVTTLTTDTTLTEDHAGPIIIDADGIILDCDGFTVTAISPGSGVGVTLHNRTGVTVKNCRVTNFARGFVLSGAANTLEANRAEDNIDAGFVLSFSQSNTLKDNVAAGGTRIGFIVSFSDGNTFEDNTAENASVRGFWLTQSSGNVLEDNTATNALVGFELAQHRDGAPPGSTLNIMKRNTAENCQTGFSIQSSSGNTFEKNRAHENVMDGYVVDAASTDNVFLKNKSIENGEIGYNDDSSGGGTAGTANTYAKNKCKDDGFGDSDPAGLCS